MKRNSDLYPIERQDMGELEERPVSLDRKEHKSAVPRGVRKPYRCIGGPYDRGKLWLPEGLPTGTKATMDICVGNWSGHYAIINCEAHWQVVRKERLRPTR